MSYLRGGLVLIVAYMVVGTPAYSWNQGSRSDTEVATEISDSIKSESRFDRRLRRKREYSQELLDSPRVHPVEKGFFKNQLLYKRNEKCYPWGWTGGEYNRMAVDLDAELCLLAKMDSGSDIDSMESSVEVDSGVTLHVSNNAYDVLSSDMSAVSRMQGSPSARANVRVMGNTIWSFSREVPSKRWGKRLKGITFDQKAPYYFNLGPIPVTLQLGVYGRANISLSARLALANLNASAVPDVQSDLYVFGGIEVWKIKAGLNADMTLADDRFKLEGKFGINVDPVNPGLVYVAKIIGDNTLSALDGDLKFIAKSEEPIPGVGTEFEYPLYSWGGFFQESEIFNETTGPTRVRF